MNSWGKANVLSSSVKMEGKAKMIVKRKTLNGLPFVGLGKYWTMRFFEPYADWQETYKWYKNREKFSRIRKVKHRNKKRYRKEAMIRKGM